MAPTVHLLGLPFSDTTGAWEHCAYTARTRDAATMLTRAGVRVVLYGGERNDAEVAEHVPLVTAAERAAWWPGYRPASDVFNDFDPAGPGWQAFNARAAAAVRERMAPRDVLGITMGTSHKPASDAIPGELLRVETGIGYAGVWAPFRVFESRAWQHFLAAREPADDIRPFDAVIPRAYDPAMFPQGSGSGGYLLFIGRLTARKGPRVAAEVARALGVRLVVAGQGARSWSRSLIVCEDGTELRGDVEYAGVVGAAERARLMGEAAAVLVPTQYFEPFGGVSVEAQLTGTPAIVSDWGGLPANVVEGVTGASCSTLADWVAAVRMAQALDRRRIREHALASWSIDAVGPQFVAYLERLATLWDRGWYELAA